MARVAMITRTISMNKVSFMVCDTVNASVSTETTTITGSLDEAEILKRVKAIVDDEAKVVVKVISVEKSDVLMGMTEDDFIKYAKPMENRTKAAE